MLVCGIGTASLTQELDLDLLSEKSADSFESLPLVERYGRCLAMILTMQIHLQDLPAEVTNFIELAEPVLMREIMDLMGFTPSNQSGSDFSSELGDLVRPHFRYYEGLIREALESGGATVSYSSPIITDVAYCGNQAAQLAGEE